MSAVALLFEGLFDLALIWAGLFFILGPLIELTFELLIGDLFDDDEPDAF